MTNWRKLALRKVSIQWVSHNTFQGDEKMLRIKNRTNML